MEMTNKKTNRNIGKPDPLITHPYRVKRVQNETHDTFTLHLEPENGTNGNFSFAAGQFNMLYMYGVGEIPISISGDPDKPEQLVHTTRAVGTVTKAMRKLKRGNVIGVRGPLGTDWPLDILEGKDVVFVAGGIGLAPLRSAMYHVVARRELYGKVVLLYGTRTPIDILFRKELERWKSRFDLDVYVTVDRAIGSWRGYVGVVTQLVARAPFDPRNTVTLICGPEIMMRFSIMEFDKRGVKSDSIYVSMERNMKCGIGHCGHCQFGPTFVCKDGPVYRYDKIKKLIDIREV
jgi:NAD(P)H-flavin reductase